MCWGLFERRRVAGIGPGRRGTTPVEVVPSSTRLLLIPVIIAARVPLLSPSHSHLKVTPTHPLSLPLYITCPSSYLVLAYLNAPTRAPLSTSSWATLVRAHTLSSSPSFFLGNLKNTILSKPFHKKWFYPGNRTWRLLKFRHAFVSWHSRRIFKPSPWNTLVSKVKSCSLNVSVLDLFTVMSCNSLNVCFPLYSDHVFQNTAAVKMCDRSMLFADTSLIVTKYCWNDYCYRL